MVFTFGFGHECTCGLSLRGCYTILEDRPGETARQAMERLWGRRWAFQYADEREAGVGPHDLLHIVTNETAEGCRCNGQGKQPWHPEWHPVHH